MKKKMKKNRTIILIFFKKRRKNYAIISIFFEDGRIENHRG
jgi:hypothetical protein